jgi:environmental stress-induced protein Ves
MTPQIVLCDAAPAQRWKNGGGLTRELLAWPSRDDWTVRISVADIGADGPFSAFPGVDRWFAVLEGGGVRLDLPEGPRELRTGSDPLPFPGEAAPPCSLIDGPTRDLNLMGRRDAGDATMQRAQPGGEIGGAGGLIALFTADELLLQAGSGEPTVLPAMALAWAAGGPPARWRIVSERPVRAWWIHFQPR